MEFKIVGLLGKAGSSKDVVADFLVKKGFIKVAYSDPMKRFAAAAFQYSNEELWGPSPRRNAEVAVDDAWWLQVMGRISFAGNHLVNEVFNTAGVGPVTAFLALLRWLADLHESRKEVGTISPRIVLQALGTAWGRDLDPDVWARYLHGTIVPGLLAGMAYDREAGLYGRLESCPGVVIPDHRYHNEVAMTKAYDGYLMKIVRPALEPKTVGLAAHSSEMEQDEIANTMFDHLCIMPEGLDLVERQLEQWWEGVPWRSDIK